MSPIQCQTDGYVCCPFLCNLMETKLKQTEGGNNNA